MVENCQNPISRFRLHPLQKTKILKEKKERKREKCPAYDTKLHLEVRLEFWSSNRCRVIPSLPLFPYLLWPGVVVPVKNPFYRPNICLWKFLVLDENILNYITVCKLFVSKLVIWGYNCLQKIIIIVYLKPYNCLQIITWLVYQHLRII